MYFVRGNPGTGRVEGAHYSILSVKHAVPIQ
jgi:hypothetical protein